MSVVAPPEGYRHTTILEETTMRARPRSLLMRAVDLVRRDRAEKVGCPREIMNQGPTAIRVWLDRRGENPAQTIKRA